MLLTLFKKVWYWYQMITFRTGKNQQEVGSVLFRWFRLKESIYRRKLKS